jgi:hypothetical protein
MNAHRILVGKFLVRRSWDDNIKVNLREVNYEDGGGGGGDGGG